MVRDLFPILLFVAGLSGCGAPQPEPMPEPVPEVPARTADPFQRGLTEADFPRIQELAPGVYSYEQLRAAGEELFTTVSMFVVTDEGVLVADGQGNFEETALMVEEIGKVTDQPITHVVICSDHGDHTAGNGAFPEGVEYIVHENSLVAMERIRERIPEIPMPETVISDRLDLTLGGRTIEILFLGRAHTGGDLVVHLPEESVLFLTEAYLHRVYPAMRSAYPTEWVAMLRRAQAMNARINVPGHGFVDSPEVLRDELQVAIEALETVIAESTRLHEMGLSPEEADAQADFGDLETWSLRESQRGMALRRVYMELNGELP
jgi:glyoxylase-like metal-dependent hydrolase (beta-lactamase superfamily II)